MASGDPAQGFGYRKAAALATSGQTAPHGVPPSPAAPAPPLELGGTR